MIGRARGWRRQMTLAEWAAWEGLRHDRFGWRFRRQRPTPPYMVDFACVEGRLVAAADGGKRSRDFVDGIKKNLVTRKPPPGPRGVYPRAAQSADPGARLEDNLGGRLEGRIVVVPAARPKVHQL